MVHLVLFQEVEKKAPAAICRKVVRAKIDNDKNILVWGDGNQTRSFMYIDDCIEGIIKIFNANYSKPINLGSSEQVSINELINIIEKIANVELTKKYQLDKPLGVRGRSSDNTLIKKVLGWEPNISLEDGLKLTYSWIYGEIDKKRV